MASLLAVRLAQRAGLRELHLVFFNSPFFRDEKRVALAAQILDLPLRSVTVKREFLRLPKMNGEAFPCGVCRKTLLERAGRIVRRRRFDLVITGEVAGKAGLSAEFLQALDEELGLARRVLRPLSAKLLPPTQAEAEGLVDRQSLLDFYADGCWHEKMINLAKIFKFSPTLSGRLCLLADPAFAQRCREFGGDAKEDLTANFVQLLEFPFVFRLPHGGLLVVATTPAEQRRLQELFLPEDVRLYVPLPGSPLGLLRGPGARLAPEAREQLIRLAAQKVLTVWGGGTARPWTVCFRPEGAEETSRLRVFPQDLREGLSLVD